MNSQNIHTKRHKFFASSKLALIIALSLAGTVGVSAQTAYNSYKGLVLAGYQGWFNAPTDGAGRGWYHYKGKNGFKPESASVDFWPDVSEYPVTYETEFKLPDGSPARTFSSYDSSSVSLHFSWMREYGLDGVFMQRFVREIAGRSGKKHFDRVLQSAVQAATRYDRAICLMYDLSGMRPGDEQILLNDIDRLESVYGMKQRLKVPTWLYHNRKPLVAVWGAGFDDNRAYSLREVEIIIDALKRKGYSVLLGVPGYWRELKTDTQPDKELHRLIRKCDIVMPWFVARYNETSYETFKPLIKKDMKWCRQNGVDYAPLCFPGFSWENLKGKGSRYIDRNSGSFFTKQLNTVIDYGAEMIYIAMFDEIDEGTAIFKCARRNELPLNGNGKFEGIENTLPSDHYLRLTGEAAKRLKKRQELEKVR